MTAQIIDGRSIAAGLRRDMRAQSDTLEARGLRRPGLAVILVGDDPTSEIHTRNERRACDAALPATINQQPSTRACRAPAVNGQRTTDNADTAARLRLISAP